MDRVALEREVLGLLGEPSPRTAPEEHLAWWSEHGNRWALLEALERYQRRGGDRDRQQLEDIAAAAGNAGACKLASSLRVWTGGELAQLRDILRAGVTI
jgi:hypothetical protein